jgi:hypothetical protein
MSRWHTTDFDLLPEHAFRPMGGGGKFGKNMTLEGGGKGSAPAPDPRMGEAALKQIELNERIFDDFRANDRPWMQGITNDAIGLSRRSADLAQNQFDFSRDVANRQLDMASSMTDRSNALSDYQLENMRFNDERYRNVAIPFEDRLLQDVNRFDSQSYKDQQVDAARADVTSAFNQMGIQAARNAGRMGIDRVIRGTNDVGMEQAKAMASAANKTRQAAEQVGLSTKMQMYGGMRGLAGLGATNAQLATGAMGIGMNGLNAGVGAMSVGNNAIGGMQGGASGMMGAAGGFLNANNSALGGFNSGVAQGIQGMGSFANLGIQAQKVNNDADPFAAILGAGAQMGAAYLGRSDRRLKADIVFVGVHEPTGLNLYEFRYIDGGATRYRGVMADEVKVNYPHAVITLPNGFDAVLYSALGIAMEVVELEAV